MSQLDLELEINTSPGRISKIENNKINPDKETIVNISKALNLETKEIASLFGIQIPDITPLTSLINEILLLKDVSVILNKVVNDLIFKMGYLASAVFLIEGDKIYMRVLTTTNISIKAIELLPRPLSELYLSLSKDHKNLTVKAIKKSKVYLTNYTYKYTVPLVDFVTANKIQEATGDKSTIIYPLEVNGKKLGAIVYVKKVISDFKDERDTLKFVSDSIAVALFNAMQGE